MHRRCFLKCLAGAGVSPLFRRGVLAADEKANGRADGKTLRLIEASRPSKLRQLTADFCARVGATHTGGKYHLTQKPFLIEGAEKLLELGTRLGKFWFNPDQIAQSYPFNSQWGTYRNLVGLAKTDYFEQVFALPFSTFCLEAHSPVERAWKRDQPESFYQAVAAEYHDLTAHLYKKFSQRSVTIVLQHWEGDWMLRGNDKKWNPPAVDWPRRCEWMQKWLAARQTGVSKARAEVGAGAKCRVAHASEVNRVADIWKGLPTVTDKVLPGVELDLISYSCYDGMKDPLTLWKCIEEIRKHARTGPLFGKGAVFLGEIGIPENSQPDRLTERWDEFMGAVLAANVLYVVHWELYCNEFNPKVQPPPTPPVKRGEDMRGFWLVRPDGSLGESGRYFSALWKRAGSRSP